MNSEAQFFAFPDAFSFDDGSVLEGMQLAYETYGELNEAKDNAVLVFHAMSGSQHAAGMCTSVPGAENYWDESCYLGWWDDFIGPNKAINTDRFFVICANYIGGCYGSSGPSSMDPSTGKEYGSRFPAVTIPDVVRSQALLLDHLGIQKLHAVTGPSVGGMLCLTFATLFPNRVDLVLPLGTGPELTSLTRLHNFEQICAIEADADFKGGDYYPGKGPVRGMTLARMIAHKTYVSLETVENRARREVVQPREGFDFYEVDHQIESYMVHHGNKFVDRFDANSYLRIINMWQKFDLAASCGAKTLVEALERCQHQQYMIFSIDTDVCFYPEEQRHLVRILKQAGVRSLHITVHSEKGHDSFLLEPDLFHPHLRYTLEQVW